MKVILRILVILLIAVAVSGGIYALVENTSLISSAEAERGTPPQMNGTDGQTFQPMEYPEGRDEPGASFTRGLSDVGITLTKLTAIVALILLVQKGLELLRSRKLKTT